MTEERNLLAEFSRILRELLGDDTISLERETTREDVKNWDSMNYVNFIVAVEMEFHVTFKIADVESFPNVGSIVDATRELVLKRQNFSKKS